MKQGWSVTIEGRTDRPFDPDDVLDRLRAHHPAVQGAGDALATTVTVDAVSALQAIDEAHDIVSAALKPARLAVEQVEAITEERQAAELERSNAPDLVGIAEIAQLANTTRQRIFQMTANRGFPAPILELAAGRVWSRAAVLGYLEGRPRRPQLIKTMRSQAGGTLSVASLRSKQKAASHQR